MWYTLYRSDPRQDKSIVSLGRKPDPFQFVCVLKFEVKAALLLPKRCVGEFFSVVANLVLSKLVYLVLACFILALLLSGPPAV